MTKNKFMNKIHLWRLIRFLFRNHYYSIRATSGINNNGAQMKIRREKRKRLKRKRRQMN